MKNIELVIAETATAIGVSAAREFALNHGVNVAPSLEAAASQLVLYFTGGGVSLLAREHKKEHKKRQEIRVDFVAGALAHRRKFGGGKGQAIAKAVGLSAKFSPSILDATAGLGRDAFVLASLGARLTLIERSAVVNVLLCDGLHRARAEVEDTALQAIVERMTLIHVDSQDFLSASAEKYDVVYLDPMFPVRKKSADVKKDMKIFHDLIGQDEDADALLERALARASYRVVVKRPRHAPALDNHKPTYSLEGKSSRFDIYALKAVPK